MYTSCVSTYKPSSQNSLINFDKDSTPSSLVYSAKSRTLQNNQNVISSNNKIMEPSKVYNSHESTHDTLYTQNAFKDSSTVHPVNSYTFSNCQGFATNNVMEPVPSTSTVHNSSESIYNTNTQEFLNQEKNTTPFLTNLSGSSRTYSDQQHTDASSFTGLFPWTGF